MDSSGNSTGISGFFLFYGVFTGTACFKFKPIRHPPPPAFLLSGQTNQTIFFKRVLPYGLSSNNVFVSLLQLMSSCTYCTFCCLGATNQKTKGVY